MADVEILFVANGDEARLTLHPETPLFLAAARALSQTRNIARPIQDYDIRDEMGVLLLRGAPVSAARGTVYVCLAIGAGGDRYLLLERLSA